MKYLKGQSNKILKFVNRELALKDFLCDTSLVPVKKCSRYKYGCQLRPVLLQSFCINDLKMTFQTQKGSNEDKTSSI